MSDDASAGEPSDLWHRIIRHRSALTVAFLVAANVMPILGVLFWHWGLFEILLLYWFESAAIGLFTVVKIVMVGRWTALFMIPFFCFHFGMFMLVHLMFLGVFFLLPFHFGDPQPQPDFALIPSFIGRVLPAAAVILVSHAISFVYNFIVRNERATSTAGRLFMAPYPRIIVMQVTLILGGMLSLVIGSPWPFLVLLVVLKTGIDVVAHLRERRRATAPAAAAPSPFGFAFGRR